LPPPIKKISKEWAHQKSDWQKSDWQKSDWQKSLIS
jgi:hypothetical protein